jgi:hypothetical protein
MMPDTQFKPQYCVESDGKFRLPGHAVPTKFPFAALGQRRHIGNPKLYRNCRVNVARRDAAVDHASVSMHQAC